MPIPIIIVFNAHTFGQAIVAAGLGLLFRGHVMSIFVPVLVIDLGTRIYWLLSQLADHDIVWKDVNNKTESVFRMLFSRGTGGHLMFVPTWIIGAVAVFGSI